jgi:DNA repair exonuclease SbcCD nuclease subunit
MKQFKSNKIGIFSDIHIGLGQDSSIWHEIVLNFGKWASETYKKRGITEIVIPGDVFHNRSEISVKTLDVCKQFFDYFKDFELIISVGNHDVFKKNASDIHSLKLLSEWKNITIIDLKPEVYKTLKNKTVSFIPWATDIENFPVTDICFGHLDIQSFYMNGLKLCDHGFESKNLFEKSKYIISGHFHKKEFREYTDGNILYVGSPFQHNFGDVGDERGIYIFDFENNNFEFIQNTESPTHKKIKISDILDKKIKPEDIKKDVPNNLICLIIDESITPDVYSVLISKIQNLEPKILKIEHAEPQKELNSDGSEEFELSDISKSLEEYVDSMDIQNKKELKDYILNIYDNLK